MGSKGRYLFKNTSIFAVGELGNKLINFILVPLYTYVLTKEQYGTVDLIMTLSIMITPLVMINIGEGLMRYALDKDADYNQLSSIAILAILFGFVISLLIFPLSALSPIVYEFRVYFYLYVVLSAAYSVITSFMRGKELLKQYVCCNLLDTFLIAVLNIFFLVYLKSGVEGYLCAYILAKFICLILSLFLCRFIEKGKKFDFNVRLAKELAVFSLAVVPTSLLWWCINSSDRIMITQMSGVAENGILAISYKIPSILAIINNIFMQAWKFSAIKEKDSSDGGKFINDMFQQYMVSSMIISATMIIFIRIITKVLFAPNYYESWEASVFLLVGYVFMGLSTFVGTVYYVEKNMIGNMLSAVVGAVVNIVLNLLLIPVLGSSGATLAALICYFTVLVYRYFDTRKYQKINVFSKNNAAMYLMLAGVGVGIYINNIWGTAVAIFIYIAFLFINRSYAVQLVKRGINIIKR